MMRSAAIRAVMLVARQHRPSRYTGDRARLISCRLCGEAGVGDAEAPATRGAPFFPKAVGGGTFGSIARRTYTAGIPWAMTEGVRPGRTRPPTATGGRAPGVRCTSDDSSGLDVSCRRDRWRAFLRSRPRPSSAMNPTPGRVSPNHARTCSSTTSAAAVPISCDLSGTTPTPRHRHHHSGLA